MEEKGEGLELRGNLELPPTPWAALSLSTPTLSAAQNPQKGLSCSQPVPTAPKRCGENILNSRALTQYNGDPG